MVTLPRTIVVGGTQSGVGKTSITLALIAAFRRRGLAVQPFKVGPDFLDPTHLGRAAGRPCYNLDGWMMGAEAVRSSFVRHSAGADLCIVEGGMGLFDGADARGPAGSTAEVAAWLGAPVVLVVDAHGMSRSLAALVKGFAEFDPSVRLGGVLLNRIGSPRHAALLANSLDGARLPRVMGGFTAGALPALASRHLGLVTADESTLPEPALQSLADAAESCCDLGALLALAEQAHPLTVAPGGGAPAPRRVRIGVARDRAFHFYYADNLEALEARGAELVEFSPLDDACLPEEVDLLYFGGGYPEACAAKLAANHAMRAAVRRHAAEGRPLYAECGGLMYLGQALELPDGSAHAMAGVLPFRSAMRTRRVALGYVEAELLRPCLLGPPGTRVRGHEFHYSELLLAEAPAAPWSAVYRVEPRRGDARLEGYLRGDLLASYVHVHFASRPEVVDHIIGRCLHHQQSARERFP